MKLDAIRKKKAQERFMGGRVDRRTKGNQSSSAVASPEVMSHALLRRGFGAGSASASG